MIPFWLISWIKQPPPIPHCAIPRLWSSEWVYNIYGVKSILVVLAFLFHQDLTQSVFTSSLISLLPPRCEPSAPFSHSSCSAHTDHSSIHASLCPVPSVRMSTPFQGFCPQVLSGVIPPILPTSGHSQFSVSSLPSETDIFIVTAVYSAWILCLETSYVDGVCIDLMEIQLYLLERERGRGEW